MWSKSFTPSTSDARSSATPVNSLVREALLEGRTAERYEKDGYAVKWTFVNDLELIFAVSIEMSGMSCFLIAASRLRTSEYSS